MGGGQMPLFRRLPKVGFSNAAFRREYTLVNVRQLCVFPDHARVTPELLRQSGMIKQVKPGGIKILGDGELDRPLRVRAHAFSDSAREKIESAGGSVELIPRPQRPVRNKMATRMPPQQLPTAS